MSEITMRNVCGIQVACRDGTCDSDVAASCIENDEYHIRKLATAGDWLIDVGGYGGHVALLGASLGMKCIVVEPLPENVQNIRMNIERNSPDWKILVMPNAIGSESKSVVDFSTGTDGFSDFEKRHRFIGNQSKGGGGNISVDTISLDDLMVGDDGLPIHVRILKLDCEGGEWAAISGASQWSMRNIDFVVGELHIIDGRTPADFSNLMDSRGFDDVSEAYNGEHNPNFMRLFVFKNRML